MALVLAWVQVVQVQVRVQVQVQVGQARLVVAEARPPAGGMAAATGAGIEAP